MTVECAHCESFVCRGGVRDASPDSCPMRGDFPEFAELYQENSHRTTAVNAALVEAAGYCRWTRVREIREFARLMGFERLGVAHGPDMVKEASLAADFLSEQGTFPILPPGALTSDPVGQAAFFQEEGTELNVLAGLSVGQEALFVEASGVLSTALVARDLRLRHNPVAALYTSRSYLQAELHGHWRPEDRPPFEGIDRDRLERVSGEVEKGGGGPRSRTAEAMALAHGLGVTHIGVTFCSGFREEARLLSRILDTNGFRVSSVCCKTGAVPKSSVGIQDSQQVRPGRPEMICNPLAQAELLNREGVEFALVLGQCVGHDAATLRHLRAPAACLVAKDRVLAHNTVAALL
jgi:uncharacterized metal-binding protein